MKTLISFILYSGICISSSFGQAIPQKIEEIPVLPSFTKNCEGYAGNTLYKFPLYANFTDRKKVTDDLTGFSLKVLTINEYASAETFEVQSAQYAEFYKRRLNPGFVPYTGAINIENTNETDISTLKPGETSRISMFATGEIEWYYRESADVLKKFLVYHRNFPARLHISEEIYTRDTGSIALPDPGLLYYPILPKSIFLPEESNIFYQYSRDENTTTVVGHVAFQSLLAYDETIKYFEDKLSTKAVQNITESGAYFIKQITHPFGRTMLCIDDIPPSYRDVMISDKRVLVVYDYFIPKCHHKIIINDVEIFK